MDVFAADLWEVWRSSAALMNIKTPRPFQENLSHAGFEEFAARGAKARGGAGRVI